MNQEKHREDQGRFGKNRVCQNSYNNDYFATFQLMAALEILVLLSDSELKAGSGTKNLGNSDW